MGSVLHSLREWINRNAVAVTVGALLALILFLFGYHRLKGRGSSSGVDQVMDAWFFDVQTQERFVVRDGSLPPIIRENGHKAVKVYMFTCGSCGKDSQMFAGYYEGFTDAYKRLAGGEDAGDMAATAQAFADGRLISRDAQVWVPYHSPEGIAIQQALSEACQKGGELKPCYPGRR